ncbi:MAG: T9SS type A sorting domain-containing protein, partial [Bacteroidota bacterium]|nr:T9SS type A sorting domain-containing protein [Bacteroidota bacterium]
ENSSVSQIPSSHSAMANFPNPFFQSTSIKLSTPDCTFAEISIHNLLGIEVARLFTGLLDAGEHTFTWDARGMPAGIYICRVHSAGSTQELLGMVVK